MYCLIKNKKNPEKRQFTEFRKLKFEQHEPTKIYHLANIAYTTREMRRVTPNIVIKSPLF